MSDQKLTAASPQNESSPHKTWLQQRLVVVRAQQKEMTRKSSIQKEQLTSTTTSKDESDHLPLSLAD
jgi:hypothetical protein